MKGWLLGGALACMAASPATAGKVMQEAIAGGVVQSVEIKQRIPGIKRSVLVRLADRVSEEQLEAMARDIRADDAGYERIFISYLLPGMEYGSGAWATTHFDPALKVKVLGLSVGAANAQSTGIKTEGRAVIGVWLHEFPPISSRVEMFEKDGRFFAESTYDDGSSRVVEYVRKAAKGAARRFDPAEPHDFGEHLLVGDDGRLEVRDREGILGVATRVRTN